MLRRLLLTDVPVLLVVYFIVLLHTGGATPFSTYFLLIVSLAGCGYAIKKNKYLIIANRKILMYQGIIFGSGMLSACMGIDRGESIYGVIKLGTVFLTILWLRQIDVKYKNRFLKTIPLLAVCLSLISIFLNRIHYLESWISKTQRLAGPFEYPNTMALFLLAGIIIAEHTYIKGKKIVQTVLCIGILLTGSRTVFLFLVGYLIFYLWKHPEKNKVLPMLFGVLVLMTMAITVFGKSAFGGSRFLTISIHASTLQGRLLYWEDAARMLIKYPAGIGYMGYFYLQKAMQTGVYSVRFVHNDWLQGMLDYGILSGVGSCLYFKNYLTQISNWKRELLIIIGLCSFFDFHMQFWSILLLVMLLWENEDAMVKGRGSNWLRYGFFIGVLCAVVLATVVSVARFWADRGDYEEAVRWNPFSVQYRTALMVRKTDWNEAVACADKIISYNQYVYTAYKVKANVSAMQGQTDDFIENERRVLQLRKYEIEEYEEYFKILLDMYRKVHRDGDAEAAEQCIYEMQQIPKLILEVKRETSPRAYRIQEKPELYFNREYEKVILSTGGKTDER